ncbi:MAG TPA: GNAT family N-acetyltransferase [Solirubrobacteraceae bacterium]|nr:GNAT family N-acetyltransferase [Solirubrobacteraceae bacterium]
MTGRPPRHLLPERPLLDGETVLRPWRDDDLKQLVLACQDPEISRWTSVPRPYSEADARAYLRQRHEAAASGSTAPMAIVHLTDGRLLGSIALARFHWYHRRAEVGYWLAREARGQGHATRAVRLICAWGLGALGLERIELLAATGNLASQRVAERSGFTREAVLRSHLRGRDGFQDMVVFGLLAGELGT